MREYIDREVVRRIINSERSKEQMLAMLEKTPTADVRENVRGEWIHKDGIYGVTFCSKCDYESHINNTNFCPKCGADMRKYLKHADSNTARGGLASAIGEAIDEIIAMCDAIQLMPDSKQGKAMLMAIRSLEAWEKVKNDLADLWLEGYSPYTEVMEIIDRYLKEVEERY